MNTTSLSYYAKTIRSLFHCTPNEATMIEDIMRTDVLHTVALDWLSADEFKTAARKAALLLAANRADYEQYYAGTRAIVAEMQAAQVTKG